ncbi:YcaO-like family protein [Geobacillus sp. FSL W8-0032]|nr:YcaO-like family protein [Geobacillus icigianus]
MTFLRCEQRIEFQGFFTYRMLIDGNKVGFRPAATHINKQKAKESVLNEALEIKYSRGDCITNFQIHFGDATPFLNRNLWSPLYWESPSANDLEWYYSKCPAGYIKGENLRNRQEIYVPMQISYYPPKRIKRENKLNWATTNGLSFDKNSLELAYLKGTMEICERDSIMCWWYKEIEAVELTDLKMNMSLKEIIQTIEFNNYDIHVYRINNDLPCHNVMVLIYSEQYFPKYALGSASSNNIYKAIEHAIYESVNTAVGLRWYNFYEPGSYIVNNSNKVFDKFKRIEKKQSVKRFEEETFKTLDDFMNQTNYNFYGVILSDKEGYTTRVLSPELQNLIVNSYSPISERLLKCNRNRLETTKHPFL